MNTFGKILSCILLVILWTHSAYALTIAENGQAKAVIAVAADAPLPEQFAAEELARFLNQITGATFPIQNEPADSQPCLLVGVKMAQTADPQFNPEKLGQDGIVIRTLDNKLILAGGYPRGTLYAVYTFLEEQLGCRWWSSTVSTIPQQQTITLTDLNIQYIPPLEYRESFWFDAFDGDWAARNKCNGASERLEEKHGGKHIYEGFVHTFYPLIPPDRYFNDHPEWFSEINGKRTCDHAQLCLTNEEMRQELVKNLKERLRNNPAATIASVSQNDWIGNCQCANCAAIDEKEGSPAGSLLHFVNAVAADIESEFPHVAIDTLAYQYTRTPPKFVKPRPNVIVRLCSIECSFSQPLADDRNAKFRDDITGWAPICSRLYIWDYTTNFSHYLLIHPNLRVLGPNVKFFADHNVKGLFEQGCYNTNGGEMAELRGWVLAKLLWNPTLDSHKLVNEFLAGYYGPAAPALYEYLQLTHNAVEASGDWLGCFSGIDAKFLTFDLLNRGMGILKKAEQAVQSDPELLFRVQVAELPILYALILRWDDMMYQAQQAKTDWPFAKAIDQVFEEFKVIAQKKNITRLTEGQEGYGTLEQAVQNAKTKQAAAETNIW